MARVCSGPIVPRGTEPAWVCAPRPCGPQAIAAQAALLPVSLGLTLALRPPSLSLSPCTPPTLGPPSAIWLPWTLAATRAGSLSPWTVPERCGGRVLRVTGTDPPGSPALHRLPARLSAHCYPFGPICQVLGLPQLGARGASLQPVQAQGLCGPQPRHEDPGPGPIILMSEATSPSTEPPPHPRASCRLAPAPLVTSQQGDRPPRPLCAGTPAPSPELREAERG